MPINFGYEVVTLGQLLAVVPFMQRFGHEISPGKWVIAATDQQLINAANTIGLFLSAFAAGFVADIIGRKKTMGLGCLLCIGGILTQYFSNSIPQITGGKILATFGFGLGHSMGPVFVAELAPLKLRGVCLSLIVSRTLSRFQ